MLHETFFCGECGYDLTGLHAVGHCPECGNRYDLGSRKGIKQPPSPLERGDQVVRYIRVFLFGAGAAIAVGIGVVTGGMRGEARLAVVGAILAAILGYFAYRSYRSEQQ